MLKTITIKTIHGDVFTIADTEDCRKASMAFAQFMNGGTMYFTVEDEGVLYRYYVPASAVDSIRVEDTEEAETGETGESTGC